MIFCIIKRFFFNLSYGERNSRRANAFYVELVDKLCFYRGILLSFMSPDAQNVFLLALYAFHGEICWGDAF